MSNVLKDAKDKIRSGSPKETEFRRGRTPERRTVNGDGNGEHYVDFVVGHEEREGKRRDKERKSALGKLTAVVRIDEPACADGWKEFKKGELTSPVPPKPRHLNFAARETLRHLHIPNIIRHSLHGPADGALRLWLGSVPPQGRRASAGRVDDQTDSRERGHTRRVARR
jgi:hypothetical protein